MAGGKMHILHPPLWIAPAVSYRNHQKNLGYFSHLIGIISIVLV